jgi:putative intracellular protease/amidase
MSPQSPTLSRRRLMGAAAVGLGAAGGGTGTAAVAAETRTRTDRNLTAAIVLYDGFTALDAVAPYEVLSRIPGASVHFVAPAAGPVTTDTRGLTMVADAALADLPRPDVLLVPGGGVRGTTAALQDRSLLSWLRTAHRTTSWTTSVCTGSLILGAAGLLRGKSATTYWSSRDVLARFGATYRHRRYVQQGKIITGAGVSAALDTALVIANRLAGDEVAQALQLALEYDPQPPFDTGDFATASPRTRRLALQLVAEADRP